MDHGLVIDYGTEIRLLPNSSENRTKFFAIIGTITKNFAIIDAINKNDAILGAINKIYVYTFSEVIHKVSNKRNFGTRDHH